MEIELTDDQRVLVEASTRFAEETCPIGSLREDAHHDPDFAARYRRQAGELGWFSLLVPEELGGGSVSGNGVVDAALVAHARGRALQPGSFVGTNVVARALATAGTDQQRSEVLPALMAGEAPGAWSISSPNGDPVLEGPVQATAEGDGFVLSGTAAFVEYDGPGGWLLVTASTGEGPSQFLVVADAPGVRVEPRASLDLTRRFAEVHLDGVLVPASAMVGERGAAAAAVAEQLALACVLLTAESAGAMDAELEMTVQYAKDRIAFGRPIGSFQAIKHLLADTSLALEMTKATVLAAARHLGEGDPFGVEAASMAKAFTGDAGVQLAQDCFQVFGGIGFTWEHDQHLYLRRLTTDAAFLGSPAWHRERLCALAGV